ncbi:unnamed protein product [Hymenolepis diminuta]|uniref:BAR domain-containing protein n=1 Tax=Hymenolepis diminuta TaxID=6216 RepID=A0A0R3SEN1_HYMDI|nr:unnamed protein product [Hymenolepis diminuta]
MAAPDSELLAEFEKAKKLHTTCESLRLALSPMVKSGHDDLFRNIGEFEIIAGKEEDVFIGKIKSGLLQTCNTFLDVTFPSLNKEMKILNDLTSSMESCQKKYTKEKNCDKQAKLEVEMKSAEVKCAKQRSGTVTLLKQANTVEKSIKEDLVSLLTAQINYYQLCLQNATQTLSGLKKAGNK